MLKLINLALVNLLLSSDNVITIALFGEELEGRERISVLFWSMLASATLQLGVLYAISLLFRLAFTQFLFGIIICYMAFRLLQKDEPRGKRLNHKSPLSSIAKTAAGNLMMSFENEATLIGLAHGDIWVAWYAILATLPIVFFASDIIVWILRRFDFVIYVGSAVLFKIGLDMIFTLSTLRPYVPAAPWLLTGFFAVYAAGLYLFRHHIFRTRLR